jgi:NAD(P)-dependent dehydrogenase (short-subunit alcohol dehydrogenase family)
MTEVFTPGGVAVITGAASGIGRAAARRVAEAGMKVVLVDLGRPQLEEATAEIVGIAGAGNAIAEPVDVADAEAMRALAGRIENSWGTPALLMNNAAGFVTGGPGGILDPLTGWQRLFEVNVFGVIHGVMAFLPGMLAAGRRARIVNTGSKQGLTNPPGNPAYNVTKAAVNAYTQNLARDLREREGSQVTAHLLVPGWTTTGDREHQPGAWLPEQVIGYMEEALGRDDFFIICPDDETSSEMDKKRILWNALDIIRNRPALSRWHPDHKDEFAAFMARDLPGGGSADWTAYPFSERGFSPD